MICLDLLPWPLGEDILAAVFAAAALAGRHRRRLAVAWASRHPGRGGWQLAWAVAAFRGRWVGRSALLGVRGPDDLRRRIVVEGGEHLVAAPGGTILLGFHLGPPNADVALRILGHRLAWLGSVRRSPGWSREAWRPLQDPRDNLCPPDVDGFWPGYLYRARRILLGGGTVFTMGDAWAGREAFRVPLPGGTAIVRSGWLTLCRQTGARVLPVLTHLAGRVQVITIHPPLPASGPGDADRLREWRRVLGSLMEDHVRRFPEQCPVLAFPAEERPAPRGGAGPREEAS
jgi:lauroyl/myristoyl acyltransferase